MCIAIVKKEGANISDEYLENCFDNNKDGAGIAYAYEGKLYICKGIFDKDKFIKTVREAEKKAQGAMLIHCRIGTSGLMDKTNCHPHIINNRCVMIHNGILHINVPNDSKISDTVLFIKNYLNELPKDFMSNENLCELIKMAIGSGNKFALLNNKGEYKIINEEAGNWVNDIWYSNTSYSYNKTKPVPVKKYDTYESWWKDKKYPLFNQEEINIDDEKLIANIKSLSNLEIMEIGEYPVVDMLTERLIPESYSTMRNEYRFRYLDDVSEEAYEEYLYEIELRGLLNELEDKSDEKQIGA